MRVDGVKAGTPLLLEPAAGAVVTPCGGRSHAGFEDVTLDAHTERSLMAVISPEGNILIELRVETTPEEPRRVVSGIPGPKKARDREVNAV
jgi:hypothetical protein